MVATRSMTRNQNHDDASSKKWFKTCNNRCVSPWSDLNHDLLFLVMMQVGVTDYLAFRGVCKSWRSLALSNMNMFIKSRPPMLLPMFDKEECCLEDIKGRKFKIPLPYVGGFTFVGLTCGYLILFRSLTTDFFLTNPITKRVLYFPASPILATDHPIRAILVFSRFINGLVFVMVNRFENKIGFCIVGKREWNYVSSGSLINDLQVFKGKIYAIKKGCRLYELRLHQEPKLTLLKIKNCPETNFLLPEFVSSDENLYVVDRTLGCPNKLLELNFGEMKWVSLAENTKRENVFFLSSFMHAAIKPESWAGPRSQYKRHSYFHDKSEEGTFFTGNKWYFPHMII